MHESSQNLDDILAFWAKLPREEKPPRRYHPVLCHLIDVASVAEAIWQSVLTSAARARIARRLGMSEAAAGRWITFLAGLHDIGKISPAFQLQVDDPEVRIRLQWAGFSEGALKKPDVNTPHGFTSALALRAEILNQAPYSLDGRTLRDIGTLVGGHHGLFPTFNQLEGAPVGSTGGVSWRQARLRVAALLASLLEVPEAERPQGLDHATSMLLAGLISVADWIGSTTEFFPLAITEPLSHFPPDVGNYHQTARRQACTALQQLGWTGWTPSTEPLAFEALFPGKEPRGVQRQAIQLADRIGHPAITIVEAPMGEGKTEAAMYLADRWGVQHGQSGYYFALPTQATSNQMFGRVREFLGDRYPKEIVNVQLLHGHAALSAEFQQMRQRHEQLFAPANITDYDKDGKPLKGDVVAADWFTYRKRGLLAPFGVGTVDQALLGVLQTKHVFVRLFALANKTVIIDEVHAYDTYMSTLLERLLEWLAALDTSVILLSATLPNERRQGLLRAYARGLGIETPLLAEARYPRISWVSATSSDAVHVEAAGTRTLTVRWVDGTIPEPGAPFPLGKQLQDALKNGGCAAVICNTVRRAQQVYMALKPYFPGDADDGLPALDLFHARYLFKDRDQRERHALRRFGKADSLVDMGDGQERQVHRPHRAVLVATQVIEQSLDLDFDLMVSDIAPIDLVLQRSGRLWRHERGPRPAGVGTLPTLWICRPGLTSEGLPVHERGFEYIYDSHVLLRSWLALKDRDFLIVPGEVEQLVEAVYRQEDPAPNLLAAVRQHWEDTWNDYRAAQEEERNKAMDYWLKSPGDRATPLWKLTINPQEEDTPGLHVTLQARTRLSEPTVQVICLTPEEAVRLVEDKEGRSAKPPVGWQLRELLRRAVTLSDQRAVHTLIPDEPPAAWRESALLRHYRLVRLDADGAWTRDGLTIKVDQELGVVISQKPGKERAYEQPSIQSAG